MQQLKQKNLPTNSGAIKSSISANRLKKKERKKNQRIYSVSGEIEEVWWVMVIVAAMLKVKVIYVCLLYHFNPYNVAEALL